MKQSLSTGVLFLFLATAIGFEAAGAPWFARTPPLIRAQKDTVGYATRPDQVKALVSCVDSLETAHFASNIASFRLKKRGPMIGAICPHDDYLYAGRGYIHVMREVKARRVILFGVSHTARKRGIQGKLIFDDFAAWKSAYGKCPISRLRNDIIKALPPELVLVSDEIHSEEHSLEGFIPILQHYMPKVEIVPILVTRMEGEKFDAAADALALTLSRLMNRHRWRLGRDVVILISADCVHYGDEEWGGRNYAPFGVGELGYQLGVAQDLSIINSSLTGTMGKAKVGIFRERVDSGDFQQPYKITWCGVYSIPFGLSVLDRVAIRAGRRAPEGFMLVYGTSIDPPELPLERVGLGVTAIATLRHWVGYTAIGYW
jgi:AmmeMemoRadiSam system protein B